MIRMIIRALCIVWSFVLLIPPSAFADSPLIRVLLEDNQKLMRLEVKGPYKIISLSDGKVLQSSTLLGRSALMPSPRGIKLDAKEWPVSSIRIEPEVDRDLILDDIRFRGAIEVHKNETGALYAINCLDVETYLYGVLPHEVAHWWPMEALKAQAVAARTYALYQIQTSKKNRYDLKNSTASQVYGGSTVERFRCKAAVDATRHQVLTYQGKIFPTFFHATCAGQTAGAQEIWKINIAPLSGKSKCPYCWFSPHFKWQAKVPLATIEEKMKLNGHGVGQLLSIQIVTQTPSSRVGSLKLTGTSGTFVMAAKDFRIWLGGDKIRSTNFKVRIVEDMAIFNGLGWGHGVGLCQWGTLGQSLLGKKYQEILSLYYPTAEINKATTLLESSSAQKTFQ